MSKQPKVSLIVPVYNAGNYLKACLDSIKKQTYKNLEVILIDDGSTDGSGLLCDEFAKQHQNVIVKHQTNAGLSASRNRGLDLATGDSVAFLDSDDYLAKDYISYLVDLATNAHASIAVCPHLEKRGPSDIRDFNQQSALTTSALSVEDALKTMLNEQGFNLQIAPKLYARRLFETTPKIRFPVDKLHEDVGTTYKLFLRAYRQNPDAKIAFGAEPKYYYNIHSGSITNRTFDPRKMDLIAQTDEMCDAVDEIFPSLKNTTNLRRLHARFSIIRQAKTARYLNPSITYVKAHKAWLKGNPEATKRDKLALASLMFGKTIFKLSWKLYELLFK